MSSLLMVVNQHEATAILHTTTDDPLDAANALQRLGPPTVVVTAGQHGAAYTHPVGSGTVPAPTVPVVDTTSAGDAILGSRALARHTPLPDALTTAVHAGSDTVQHTGATPRHHDDGAAPRRPTGRLGSGAAGGTAGRAGRYRNPRRTRRLTADRARGRMVIPARSRGDAPGGEPALPAGPPPGVSAAPRLPGSGTAADLQGINHLGSCPAHAPTAGGGPPLPAQPCRSRGPAGVRGHTRLHPLGHPAPSGAGGPTVSRRPAPRPTSSRLPWRQAVVCHPEFGLRQDSRARRGEGRGRMDGAAPQGTKRCAQPA
ncbi:PfkB family carbohydrate kinase [Micromonospora sp. NPDC000018]|uniref:PfkB family carbohydrate kinase n=1 Tax=Micromonospora sp. NPDC000018 TaxID=3154239 RepID=UPI00332F3C94